MTFEQEARAALDAKAAAERQLAKAADCPPWRHALFGIVMAGLVATPALPLPLRLGALALILIMIAVIVQMDRRRMGMFVSGYRRGKTRIVAFALLAAILPLYLFGARAAMAGDLATPLWLAGPVFIISVIGSVTWQRVFVSELGA